MYRYEYEKNDYNLKGWGALGGNVYNIETYKEIINKRGKEGWRYVGYIPTKQRGTGHIQEIELIFEIKEN